MHAPFIPCPLANMISPSAALIPGLAVVALWLAVPGTLLAAVLERPFVSRAGVRRGALWLSMQASTLTLMVQVLLSPLGLFAPNTLLGLIYPIAAIAVSVAVECWYYDKRMADELYKVKRGWILAANVCSSFVLVSLIWIAESIAEACPTLHWQIEPYHDRMLWGSAIVCGTVLVASFCVPPLYGRNESAEEDQSIDDAVVGVNAGRKARRQDAQFVGARRQRAHPRGR